MLEATLSPLASFVFDSFFKDFLRDKISVTGAFVLRSFPCLFWCRHVRSPVAVCRLSRVRREGGPFYDKEGCLSLLKNGREGLALVNKGRDGVTLLILKREGKEKGKQPFLFF